MVLLARPSRKKHPNSFLPRFTSISPQVERLAAIRKLQRQHSARAGRPSPPPCEPFPPTSSGDHPGAAGGLRRPLMMGAPPALALGSSSVRDPANPDRAWLYQTCSEFGFYQASWVCYGLASSGQVEAIFSSNPPRDASSVVVVGCCTRQARAAP